MDGLDDDVVIIEDDDEEPKAGSSSSSVVSQENKMGATAIIGESKFLNLNDVLGPNISRIPLTISSNAASSTEQADIAPSSSTPTKANNTARPTSSAAIPKKPVYQWQNAAPFLKEYSVLSPPNLDRDYSDMQARFRCTFDGCNKRLSTNVNFMYHVWAHAKRELAVLYEYEAATNATCSDCLRQFHSMKEVFQHRLLVHTCPQEFEDPHAICHICEMEIPKEKADLHAASHNEKELPYLCADCGWRTSSRRAFILHYEEYHNSGNVLLCPFCFERTLVRRPAMQKGKRGSITADSFVKHIMLHARHENHQSKHCPKCAVHLVCRNESEMRERWQKHRILHDNLRVKVEKKQLAQLYLIRNRRVTLKHHLPPFCVDCGEMICTVSRHYRKEWHCPSEQCKYRTKCTTGADIHKMFCPVSATSGNRLPYGIKTMDRFGLLSFLNIRKRLTCSICGYHTRDSDQIADHLLKKCTGGTAIFEGSPVKCLENSVSPQSMNIKRIAPIAQPVNDIRPSTPNMKDYEEWSSISRTFEETFLKFVEKRGFLFKDSSKEALKTTVGIINKDPSFATNSYMETLLFSSQETKSTLDEIDKLFPVTKKKTRRKEV